ncbi:protein chiffon-like isoform X2 [Prorops nasuta]
MLERALIQPQQCSVDPLDNAQSWGIPIWATDKLKAWLDKIYTSLKDTNSLEYLKDNSWQNSRRNLKVKNLKGSYLKFESFDRRTRPVFIELQTWPFINYNSEAGECPFDTKRKERAEKNIVNKDKNKRHIQPLNKDQDKEMTRRPRTTASRARRTEQLVAGYCEICRVDYRDLSKHLQSEQHMNFVRNEDNFLSLDTLINAGANVEAFLKLNGGKEIRKNCNLFPNGDRSLHNAVLPDDKGAKSPKSLENFAVDEIKMVQCNGARRNLELKLSSPHNLRTRAKHESGHLLRSKGSPWHEMEKSEKFYDKLEGFTIKKRSKGTIWIEEEDPDDKYNDIDELKRIKRDDEREEVLKDFNLVPCKDSVSLKNDSLKTDVESNTAIECPPNHKDNRIETLESARTDTLNCEKVNGFSANCIQKKLMDEVEDNVQERLRNDEERLEEEEVVMIQEREGKVEDPGLLKTRTLRRGARATRGRHRLSVEERLIEDNRAYYKVEVLGNKLRSSAVPACNLSNSPCKANEEKKDAPSSEKPVVVRFKRVRKSELSLLSDEAESFMFGETKRDDSSEVSDPDNSSVLPRDTESEERYTSSICLSSSLNNSSPLKQELLDDESQDSNFGRAKKRRRTQAEALIKDNADYYKFEVPGSRLRYQAPLTGIRDPSDLEDKPGDQENSENDVGIMYPSKPSPAVEKMKFSFEAVPKSEPWYQTYERQDKGAELWHYFSESDTRKPFLLPYEIENFHEILLKNMSRVDGKRKGKGRFPGCVGRSPRKSPRCHASTLAIMSTIIRKREQNPPVCTSDCESIRSQTNTPKLETRVDKSDVDEELKEMAKTIDDMLAIKTAAEVDDSFEADNLQALESFESTTLPKGPPPNLLELLDKCHEISNYLENSSCASSECGEGSSESPLKRRKKRKNRTGWPGNKMRRKLQSKHLELEGEDYTQEKKVQNEEISDRLLDKISIRGISEEKRTDESLAEGEEDEEGDETKKSEFTDEFTDKKFMSEDERLKENLTASEENHEQSNDENHELFRKDNSAAMVERQFNSKTTFKKRQRLTVSSDTCESHSTIENHEVLFDKSSESTGTAKKHLNSSSKKRQQRTVIENSETELECHRRNGARTKKRMSSRKRKSDSSSDAIFDDENLKKEAYISINCKKPHGLRKKSEVCDSPVVTEQELDSLSGRVSPTLIASSLEQRRSSIEFQPVVRMMKIDDKADMDHSILSVTVASNRRLRSSSSPRSSTQHVKKRLKTGRGQFRRWLKNS